MADRDNKLIQFNEVMMDALIGLLNTYEGDEEKNFTEEYLPKGATREQILDLLRDHNLYNVLVVREMIHRQKTPLTQADIDDALGTWVDGYLDDLAAENEQVYQVVVGVDKYVGDHEHLQRFKTTEDDTGKWETTYYETYGGGPQGGYFVRTFYPTICIASNGAEGDCVEEVYSVSRTWGTPFEIKKLRGKLKYDEDGDGTAGTLRYTE